MRNGILSSGLALLLCAPFSPAGAGEPLGRYRADFAVSRADFADSIDIEWSGGQVYVPVTTPEGRRYRFLLDTGAGQSVVFAGTPLADGASAGSIIARDATGRSDTVPMVMLPPLTLGTTTLTGCQATVQRGGTGLDGILGFDLVNGGLSMQIDVPHRRLVITDRPLKPGPADISLKYRLDYHVPYIDIIPFGRHRQRVLFDTGSSQFFAMNRQQLDEALAMAMKSRKENIVDGFIDEGRAWGSHAIGHYGAETPGEVQFFCLQALQVGDYSFTDIHCRTTQGGSHLGAPLLSYGVVAFDARRQRLLFQPAAGLQAPFHVGNRQLEIAFVADAGGRPQVGLVWPQGTPWRQGFRQGDIIELIDQRPVLSLSQLMRWGFERGREYVFTVSGADGQRRQVRWVRLPDL